MSGLSKIRVSISKGGHMETKDYRFGKLAKVLCIVAVVCALIEPSSAFASSKDAMNARHLTERAKQTLETFSEAPEMGAFRNLLKNARGVFIAPQVIRGAFIVGASGGTGALIARNRLTQNWVGPAFYTIGEASFGFQAGADSSEIVLLVMTDRGVNSLLENSIKLGADIGLAVGPVGMGAAASTANLSADIISFSRSKGLYGGISIDGAIVKTRTDLNDAYYGVITTPVDILLKGSVKNPHSSSLLNMVIQMTKPDPRYRQGDEPPPGPTGRALPQEE
jgi:SH3 domain-containing YSC84-like protein 1